METPNALTPFLYLGPPTVTVETPEEAFFLGREFGLSSFIFQAVRTMSWKMKALLTVDRHKPLHERLSGTFSDNFGIGIVAHSRGTIYRSIYLTDCMITDGGMHLEQGVAADEVEGVFEQIVPLPPPKWLTSRLMPPTLTHPRGFPR